MANFIKELTEDPTVLKKFRNAAKEAAGNFTAENAKHLVSKMYAANG